MSILRKKFVWMIMPAMLTTVGHCDDYLRQIYARKLVCQPLTTARLTAIEQQQVPPHQAAEWLLQAGNFTTHSATFAPYLHNLYYRLGQLTANPETTWNTGISDCCNALERYLALFRMLEEYPEPTGEILLTALAQSYILPSSDRQIYTGKLTLQPVWQSSPGSRFTAAFIVLPRRALPEAAVTASPLTADGQNIPPLAVQLMSVNYSYARQSAPDIRPATATTALTTGMQIYQLSIDIPADAPAGIYRGTVSVTSSPQAILLQQLSYQLEITDTPQSRSGD